MGPFFQIKWILLILIVNNMLLLSGQELKPGFDPNEYAEILRIAIRQKGAVHDTIFPSALRFDMAYQSPAMGMDNAWQLWTPKASSHSKTAVISIRATTQELSSWTENLYSVMVNATGKIQLEKDFTFIYQLAKNPKASVHIGWLIGTAYLQRDITPKIDSCYQKGIKDFIISGHSQGGAISYLITAFYRYEQLAGRIPKDIRFKTYASASPKPGNLYFAHDYESYTQNGWAYNVTNTEDWVPQVPLSMQSAMDFVDSNPFKYYRKATQELPVLKKWIVRGKFKGIMKKLDRSKKNYNKIMGKQFRVVVNQYLKSFEDDVDFKSTNYQRCGNQISLLANEEYYVYVRRNHPNVFRNHGLDAYQLLLEMYYAKEMKPEYILYTNHTLPFHEKFPSKPKIIQTNERKL